MNLAVNARDAMPSGGKLTIETPERRAGRGVRRGRTPDVGAGPYVLLAVTDTGCGMDAGGRRPASSSRSSPPRGRARGPGWGWRPSTASSSRPAGTSRSTASSGVGTTFKVYLPRGRRRPADGGRPAGRLAAAAGPRRSCWSRTRTAVRALARLVLQACGYTVLEAGGRRRGACGSADGHAGPIHLLVTDVVMPGLGGRELAERLRGRHPGLQVLFMSGYTDDAVVRHGVLADGGGRSCRSRSPRPRWPARSARCWTR